MRIFTKFINTSFTNGNGQSSDYSNSLGGGYGFGTSDGKGCNLYPHALVQYWKDKI